MFILSHKKEKEFFKAIKHLGVFRRISCPKLACIYLIKIKIAIKTLILWNIKIHLNEMKLN